MRPVLRACGRSPVGCFAVSLSTISSTGCRFRIDTFPRSLAWLQPFGLPELHNSTYHELPWVGVRGGWRAESTKTRWKEIAPLVEAHGVRSVVDIGSSAGWFGFKLAERGVSTIAVERSLHGLRLGLYTRKKSGLDDVSFLAMEVAPSTVEQLPAADCVLLLSVWHHFVREWGFEAATGMLEAIWRKTGKPALLRDGRRRDACVVAAAGHASRRAQLADELPRGGLRGSVDRPPRATRGAWP